MPIRPRRSVLYLPASNARALEKARSLPADALILDLEGYDQATRPMKVAKVRKGQEVFVPLIMRVPAPPAPPRVRAPRPPTPPRPPAPPASSSASSSSASARRTRA